MDDAGTLLPAGTTGEIVIRGPNVTAGYESNPEANAVAFHDGWFRTGDQGAFDPDGYLTITGRLKEIINRGGEKISPREVDEVLLTHPAVAQAVTFALPAEILGEEVAAAIVLREGSTATTADIQAFAAERLAKFKVPVRLEFLDEIPKAPPASSSASASPRSSASPEAYSDRRLLPAYRSPAASRIGS